MPNHPSDDEHVQPLLERLEQDLRAMSVRLGGPGFPWMSDEQRAQARAAVERANGTRDWAPRVQPAPESIRERVARAIHDADGWDCSHEWPCPNADLWRRLADAALTVLRGPHPHAQALQRVEAEADLTDEEADAADVCAENWRRMGCEADYARCASLADQARTIADRIRAAVRGQQ